MARILVIDDDAGMRGLLVNALGASGHVVVEAAGGLDGVSLAKADPFDLIIVDIVMPQVDGIDTILKLRKQGTNAPVIVITGIKTVRASYEYAAHAVGACKVIAKPFSLETLLKAINEALATKKK